MTVGLVVVSHSAKIAQGVVDLAAQMAADVRIVAAGGTDDGGIGTSFEKVQQGLTEAESGDGVLVLCDLGSAVMTAETAVEFVDDPSAVAIADAPLVEGTIAAAVRAQGGSDLHAVRAAAEEAAAASSPSAAPDASADPDPSAAPDSSGGEVSRSVTVVNEVGLHARPAALFVQTAGQFDAELTVNGADASSLLEVMSLGARKGTELQLTGTGPQAREGVDALAELVESGFGED
ncbi:phosphocarrier protein HPr /dihydroxyacetone kinase DhaM subunit [Branchiibius hedensis]|uniref:Phosphocarrier protein HPr n=1 Tax=Branchiibius hedensis TaxID=672460 RepID=A0A2Y9C117_9MICO|nr:dihydroxyacetone kinase phosphoryl donor subunit DhaM [Branchiibius hedensis]PWJ24686.1 phosphocarrier protein HPr /dihydroxyacetone kinase DhaM subunit [Branchiibius hedensis]SSA33503.1 Phosphocarrier protein HPr /dihydroxyacetone kinase DhaM subunit [Branchiibius hedensis]